MEILERFFELDFVSLILGIVTVLLTLQMIDKLLIWLCEKTGIEFKHVRQKREEHELLIKTTENLAKLQERYEKDSLLIKDEEVKIRNEFSDFVTELKSALNAQKNQMETYAENRISDKEKSKEIQKELYGSIDKLAEGAAERKEQIKALMCGTMELLGDKIDQRFSKYIAMKGIPENEVDEFDGLWNAYHNKLNGNHGRTQKYKYVKEHLPVLPVEINPIYEEGKIEK